MPTPILGRVLASLTRLSRLVVGIACGSDRGWAALAVAGTWLVATTERLATLSFRLQSGALKPVAPARHAASPARAPEARAPEAGAAPGASPALRLPRGFAWLARELPDPSPIVAEFQALLADPELQALLAQEPRRLARILRPLCRALGIAPPEPPAEPAPAEPGPADPAAAAAALRIPGLPALAGPPTRLYRRLALLCTTTLFDPDKQIFSPA